MDDTRNTDVRIRIRADQHSAGDGGADLFLSEEYGESEEPEQDRSGPICLETDGTMRMEDGRLSVSYEETELTGMAGSTTTVSFDPAEPGLVTMLRSGTVRTVLVFEEGKRHHCVYETPYFPIEVGIHSLRVKNGLGKNGGRMELDYVVEIHGAGAERAHFQMQVTPQKREVSLES